MHEFKVQESHIDGDSTACQGLEKERGNKKEAKKVLGG